MRMHGVRAAFREALHEGAQPLIRHIRDEIVMHTALAKKGMGTLLGGVGLQVSVIAQGFACRPEEAQQDHGKGVEQPQAVAARGRADVNPAHAHAKAQILGIPKTALDAPAFGVVVNESPRAFGGGARSQTPGFLHVLGLHAHHGTHPVLVGGHMSSAQDACTSSLADPLCRCPHLALRIGGVAAIPFPLIVSWNQTSKSAQVTGKLDRGMPNSRENCFPSA